MWPNLPIMQVSSFLSNEWVNWDWYFGTMWLSLHTHSLSFTDWSITGVDKNGELLIWSNLFDKLFLSLFFFHPVCWAIIDLYQSTTDVQAIIDTTLCEFEVLYKFLAETLLWRTAFLLHPNFWAFLLPHGVIFFVCYVCYHQLASLFFMMLKLSPNWPVGVLLATITLKRQTPPTHTPRPEPPTCDVV